MQRKILLRIDRNLNIIYNCIELLEVDRVDLNTLIHYLMYIVEIYRNTCIQHNTIVNQ